MTYGKYIWNRGFSLVEIAIVLVVIGLLVAGGVQGLAAVTATKGVAKTEQRMATIQSALTLYVIQNGCLPCPTLPNATSGPTGRATDGTAYSSGCGAGTACTVTHGIVPWVNLGMARDDVIDAYGNFIGYAVSPGSATQLCNSVATPALNISNTSLVKSGISTYPCGSLTVNDADGTEQTTVAAYVLISHGLDGSGGYTSSGSQKADFNASGLQTCNTVTTTGLTACPTVGYVTDSAKGRNFGRGYFDDIVKFVSAPVLIQSCGAQACGNS